MGVRLPISLACRKARMNPVTSSGEMAKTTFRRSHQQQIGCIGSHVFNRTKSFHIFHAQDGTCPPDAWQWQIKCQIAWQVCTHSISPVGISSLRNTPF